MIEVFVLSFAVTLIAQIIIGLEHHWRPHLYGNH